VRAGAHRLARITGEDQPAAQRRENVWTGTTEQNILSGRARSPPCENVMSCAYRFRTAGVVTQIPLKPKYIAIIPVRWIDHQHAIIRGQARQSIRPFCWERKRCAVVAVEPRGEDEAARMAATSSSVYANGRLYALARMISDTNTAAPAPRHVECGAMTCFADERRIAVRRRAATNNSLSSLVECDAQSFRVVFPTSTAPARDDDSMLNAPIATQPQQRRHNGEQSY